MKDIIEIRTNAIYSASEKGGKLKPQVEVILIHTDGKQYMPTGNGNEIRTTPILRETRFTADMRDLDRLIGDLQKTKLQMTTIEQNCRVLNDIVSAINTAPTKDA